MDVDHGLDKLTICCSGIAWSVPTFDLYFHVHIGHDHSHFIPETQPTPRPAAPTRPCVRPHTTSALYRRLTPWCFARLTLLMGLPYWH